MSGKCPVATSRSAGRPVPLATLFSTLGCGTSVEAAISRDTPKRVRAISSVLHPPPAKKTGGSLLRTSAGQTPAEHPRLRPPEAQVKAVQRQTFATVDTEIG